MRAAVAFGSNLGDREQAIRRALRALQSVGDVVAVSSLYETAPVGGPPQGRYLNGVALVDTALAPDELMDRMLEIERTLGRVRREPMGPRVIDLDLVLTDGGEFHAPNVDVPHPRMTQRRFVLEPLVEVWPEATLPDGTRVRDLLPAVTDQDVVRWGEPPAIGPRAPADLDVSPRTMAIVVFVVTGLLAVAIWIGLGWFL